MPGETSVPHPLQPCPAPTADSALPHPPGRDTEDQLLLRRIAARDPHAFEQLYQHYAGRLLGYLRRLLPPQVLPEDVLDDVMLLVWLHANRYDPGKPLVAWLFALPATRLLRLNALHDRGRRRHRERPRGVLPMRWRPMSLVKSSPVP
jgi:DNA-directed RNA polymerase specialized sigma24 family protein